jgi:hypothetical protein
MRILAASVTQQMVLYGQKLFKLAQGMKIIYTTIIAFILSFGWANAQENQVSPDQAIELFRNGRYAEALPMYQHLIERYDREPKFNYYLGVCLVEQRQNYDEAIERLKFASTRRVSRDAHYYLGKAYQHTYRFDSAIEEYEVFLKYASNSDPRREVAKRAVQDCESATRLTNKYFSIKVTNKDTVAENNFIAAYNFPEECGTLAPNKTFFKTGVPPENLMYRTEKGNEVFFVLEESDTATHDLYKMEQLLDRWSGSKNLRSPVNSDYDERTPFLMVDGTTFFFASDRPGGMGGLDIYRSIYDPESNSFSEPENIGPPFNSPADDYMFAADPFGQQAWFTTNRGVAPGQAVVVRIVWDNTVIKNLAEDTEQIRELAQLPLAMGNVWEKEQAKQQAVQPVSTDSEREFVFHINDTIVYTNYNQFLSDAARAEFKRGQMADMEKDSLEQLMRNKRQQYAQSYNQQELTQLMDEILELEQKVYGQDDRVKRHFIRARQLETEKITQLIDKGAYRKVIPKNNNNSSLEDLEPGDFSFFSDEEFRKRKEKLTPVYQKYFTPAQIKTLQRTDSMYTWANILKLEASNLLEQSVNYDEEPQERSLFEKLKNVDTLNKNQTSDETSRLISKSKELHKQALDMYHEALDKKYNIYQPRLEKFTKNSAQPEMEQTFRRAQSYFEDANNQIDNMAIWNPEKYEQLGGLKRQAIEMIENELVKYASGDNIQKDNMTLSSTKPDNNIQDNYQTIQNSRDSGKGSGYDNKNQADADTLVESAFTGIHHATENQSLKPVFKVQIGVFKNAPDSGALSKIADISSVPVAGKDLTKYFAGNYSTYEDAYRNVPDIRKKGFPGAFVVAFLNGEQISVNEARKMTGQ